MKRQIQTVWGRYEDEAQWGEYVDVGNPISLGRRRPRTDEWGDYIAEEQSFYIERLMNGEYDEPEEMTNAECVKRYALKQWLKAE